MANQNLKLQNEEKLETKNIFQTFCDDTTLHGCSYLSKDISRIGRFIWSAFLMIIFSVSIFFIYININQVAHTFLSVRMGIIFRVI